MTTLPTIAALVIALAGACASTSAIAAPLTPQQLNSDFQLARHALEEAHGGIYRYTSKEQMDRVFDAAQARLQQPMEPLAFERILAPAVAALRCGHTGVRLSPTLQVQLEQSLLLPLDVKLIGTRLFILRDFDRAGKLAGREIMAINGVDVAHIVRELMAAAPGDGFITTGRAQRVARKFREELFTQLGMQGGFALRLRAGAGSETVAMLGQPLAALKQASAERYPQDQRSKKFIALTLRGDGVASLQVFNFSDEEEDGEGGAMLTDAFTKIAAAGVHTLLLDLRDNGGGEDRLGKLLFAHLVDAPFPYYAELTVKRNALSFASQVEGDGVIPAGKLTARADGLYSIKHPNLGMQQPALPTFKGKVIALINGRSFSTTSELITQLHDKGRATFVGEESGGAYHGNSSGNDVTLVLPHSGLKVVIPLVTYTLAVRGQHPNGRGVVPQVPVTPTIDDYLNGRDVVLEKALALAHSR